MLTLKSGCFLFSELQARPLTAESQRPPPSPSSHTVEPPQPKPLVSMPPIPPATPPRIVIYYQTQHHQDGTPCSILPLITQPNIAVTHVNLAAIHLNDPPGNIHLVQPPVESLSCWNLTCTERSRTFRCPLSHPLGRAPCSSSLRRQSPRHARRCRKRVFHPSRLRRRVV